MSTFIELINSDQPVLVDFTAEWSGSCDMMDYILNQLISRVEGKARIIKIDIDKNPVAAGKYGIRSLPTLMIFKGGEIKWRQSGIVPPGQLNAILKSI